MSVNSDRDELERQQRKQKIEKHLNEGSTKAQHKAAPKTKRKAEPPDALPTEPTASAAPTTEERQLAPSVPVHDASAPHGLRYRPLKAWERWEGNRVVQFRPMTKREREAEEDAQFLASASKADQAHKEKVKRAKQESDAWAKEDRQRREHEEQTGMRPWESGRYVSVEEAIKRGYLAGGGGED